MKKILSLITLFFLLSPSFGQDDNTPPSFEEPEPGTFTDCVTNCNPSTYFNCVLKYYQVDGTYLGSRTCKLQFPKTTL